MSWNFNDLSQSQAQSVGHSRLYSTARGQGPSLLFVHGGFHGAWCWAPFLRFFEKQNIPAAALDLPGHGGLIPPANFLELSVGDMAVEVANAAKHIGSDIILAGHSLGALVAMAAAEHVKPSALILIAPAPPANVTEVKLLPPFPTDQAIAPPPESRARKWFLSGYSRKYIAPYMTRLCPESPGFLNGVYKRNVAVDPAWVQGPALCLSGGKDDSPLHVGGQDEAVAAFFGGQLHKLPEAGHCLMLDDSGDQAAKTILAWLQHNSLTG